MDHRIGVAEALAEFFRQRNARHALRIDGVEHHHLFGVDRLGAQVLADAERVAGGEGVGAQLDASADLADVAGLLEHLHAVALAHQGQRRGEPADAATGHQHGAWVYLRAHVNSTRRACGRCRGRSSGDRSR
ncbi:hypothetical protein D3C87_1679990 [compost metagenome]